MKKLGIYFLLSGCVCAEVRDFGVFGSTFPVFEKNIINVLKDKMNSEAGRKLLGIIEEKHKLIAKEKHYIPKAVHGLKPTKTKNSYVFDPSISLSNDLSDHQGTVFYKAGTLLNPLDTMTLTKSYVFIDGTRPKQIDWVKKMIDEKEVIIILVDGDPLKIMKDHEIEVFFDQDGEMTNRFQLMHVPCVMEQEGKKLRITELTEEEIAV